MDCPSRAVVGMIIGSILVTTTMADPITSWICCKLRIHCLVYGQCVSNKMALSIEVVKRSRKTCFCVV